MYILDGGVWRNLAANLHQIFKVYRHQDRKTRIILRQFLIRSYLHFSKSMIKHCNSILAPLNWYVRVPNADNSKMVAESAMKSSRLPEKSCVKVVNFETGDVASRNISKACSSVLSLQRTGFRSTTDLFLVHL